MDAKAFEAKYGSVADDLAAATELNRVLFLAQFAIDSGWGTSQLALANNLAKIKHEGYFGTHFGGGYAAYDSLKAFEGDYLRILNKPQFENLRGSAGESLTVQVKAMGDSAWDSGHYDNGEGPGSSLGLFAQEFTAEETKPTQDATTPFTWYTIARGDKLVDVAAKFDVSVEVLVELNRDRITDSVYYIGQDIRIPIK